MENPKIEASTYFAFIVNHPKNLESLYFHPGSKNSLYHQTTVNFSHHFSKCEIMYAQYDLKQWSLANKQTKKDSRINRI